MITVLLVDHPAAVLRALRESLVGQDQISIVGEAGDAHRALRLAESLRPQVIVIDAEMANADVPTLAQQLHTRVPASALVLLTLEPARLASLLPAERSIEIVSKVDGISAAVATIRRAGR
jgi:chemotaxis response regulator CheB